MKKLLTIAIPTYNRAEYLDICLQHIYNQYCYKDEVEIIVSNNCSTDKTGDVVAEYQKKGLEINYIYNKNNIGADGNIAQCYCMASGKYVLIMGDDDILLDGAIEKILKIAWSGEYGVIYLNPYSFRDDYLKEKPFHSNSGTIVYDDVEKYLKRLNYMTTFISSNVINKSYMMKNISINDFVGTGVVQLCWVLSAIFLSGKNICIEDYLVAAKSENTGGYRLCKVFGENTNKIFRAFMARDVDERYFDIINRKLLKLYFPHYIRIIESNSSSYSFKNEKYFQVLFPVYFKYMSFWIVTMPTIFLPLKVSKLWLKILNKIKYIS